jgi:hypothetical protein
VSTGMGDTFLFGHGFQHSRDTNMAIIINDYQPSGTDTIEV